MACSKHLGVCRNHTFEMRAVQGQVVAVPGVAVEFCPMANSVSQTPQNIFPTFNQDAKYYTAGFILAYDQHYAQLNDTFEKDRFDRCVASKLAPHSNMYVPQPSNNNRWCHVCRTNYDDYIEHTADESHRSNIQQSLGDRYIQELTAAYKEPLSTKSPKPSFVARPTLSTRSSTRIREAYQRRKDKEHLVADVSTMTSQKNHKLEDFEQRVKCKTKRIRKAQAQGRRTQKF